MDEVEELFVKNFAEDDRLKAMKYLKPNQTKESHALTFFIGNASIIKYKVITTETGEASCRQPYRNKKSN